MLFKNKYLHIISMNPRYCYWLSSKPLWHQTALYIIKLCKNESVANWEECNHAIYTLVLQDRRLNRSLSSRDVYRIDSNLFPISFEKTRNDSGNKLTAYERRRKLISRFVNASSELIPPEQSSSQLPLINDSESIALVAVK